MSFLVRSSGQTSDDGGDAASGLPDFATFERHCIFATVQPVYHNRTFYSKAFLHKFLIISQIPFWHFVGRKFWQPVVLCPAVKN